MRLKGGRTGKRAVVCEGLELTGLMKPFDLEVWYGERVAVLGSNGSGKSHFLRLLAGGGTDPDVEHRPVGDVPIEPVDHTGGPGSAPGCARAGSCRPTSTPSWSGGPCWRSCTAATSTATGCAASRPPGRSTATSSRTPPSSGSSRCRGGQQARFQILLLELSGATLLLLDEPTDNLDVESAEALEEGLEAFEGTVLAVTHDRWFARGFDRFLVYGADGSVYESDGPVWDEGRVAAGPLTRLVEPHRRFPLNPGVTRVTLARCASCRVGGPPGSGRHPSQPVGPSGRPPRAGVIRRLRRPPCVPSRERAAAEVGSPRLPRPRCHARAGSPRGRQPHTPSRLVLPGGGRERVARQDFRRGRLSPPAPSSDRRGARRDRAGGTSSAPRGCSSTPRLPLPAPVRAAPPSRAAFVADHADLFRLSADGVDALEVVADSPLLEGPDLARVRDRKAAVAPRRPPRRDFRQTFGDLDRRRRAAHRRRPARRPRRVVSSSVTGDETCPASGRSAPSPRSGGRRRRRPRPRPADRLSRPTARGRRSSRR